jgi:histidine triad (HIT) family protein
MADTIFHKIIRKEIPSYVVWEDEKHLAFLTPFPNTPGVTVVIPKTDYGDYVFSMPQDAYTDFLKAIKTVSTILKQALEVQRVALVFEGTGVAYVHAKLYPLHGKTAGETNVWADERVFTETYLGYITTLEGPEMDNDSLKEIQEKIIQSYKNNV